jgi:chromosome segregation ATPase
MLKKSLVLFLLLFLVFLVPSYSGKSYTITETELLALEAQIKQAQTALNEAQKSLQIAQTSLTASQAEIETLQNNLKMLERELATLNRLYQTLWTKSKQLKAENDILVWALCLAIPLSFLIGGLTF